MRVKVNSMIDEEFIDALYAASRAGVRVDVFVRGICGIRPGVPGMSENVRVRSVIGRYLEHSRVFAFRNGGDEQVWIGSADMMHRNLDRRIEALVLLEDEAHVQHCLDMFDLAMSDGTATWRMNPDASWTRRAVDDEGRPLVQMHDEMMRRISARPRKRSLR